MDTLAAEGRRLLNLNVEDGAPETADGGPYDIVDGVVALLDSR